MRFALYVAVADNRPGQVKIGISKNPDARCGTLAAKGGGRVRMPVVIWMTDERRARELERSAHWQLKRQDVHVDGEWFLGSPHTAMWAIYSALRKSSQSWAGTGEGRDIPLIEWGIGFLFGYKRQIYDWEKVNNALVEIERRPA